jgi:hypothetical protein
MRHAMHEFSTSRDSLLKSRVRIILRDGKIHVRKER